MVWRMEATVAATLVKLLGIVLRSSCPCVWGWKLSHAGYLAEVRPNALLFLLRENCEQIRAQLIAAHEIA